MFGEEKIVTAKMRREVTMAWLKQNVTVGNWIIIIVLIAGWIGQAYVSDYKRGIFADEIKKLDGVEVGEIELNSDYRKQGHSFTESDDMSLEIAYSHAINKDVHMPFAEKVKVFVPRTEFETTVKHLEKVSVKQDKIYDLLIDMSSRLPK